MKLPTTAAISLHASRGMSRARLVEIYGRDAVLRVLGAEEGVERVETRRAQEVFGVRLMRARAAKNHTRRNLADIVACSVEAIAAYEADASIPRRADLVAAFAAYLGEDLGAVQVELALCWRERTAQRRAA